MSKVLKSRKIVLNTRKKSSNIMYGQHYSTGSRHGQLPKAWPKDFLTFEMWTYRRMLRMSWTEKVTNEEVLKRAKTKKRLYNIIQTKKLQYFGHIIRQSGDTLHRTVLDGKVKGSRGCGRPRTKWTTNITKWTGLEYYQAGRQAGTTLPRMEDHCIQPSVRGRNTMMMMIGIPDCSLKHLCNCL